MIGRPLKINTQDLGLLELEISIGSTCGHQACLVGTNKARFINTTQLVWRLSLVSALQGPPELWVRISVLVAEYYKKKICALVIKWVFSFVIPIPTAAIGSCEVQVNRSCNPLKFQVDLSAWIQRHLSKLHTTLLSSYMIIFFFKKRGCDFINYDIYN